VDDQIVLRAGYAGLVVALPPGTGPISPGQPVAGHAYFDMSWDDVLPPCVVAGQLRVTPPDSYQSLTIGATPPGGFAGQMTVCSGGSLNVQPVRPARSN
jgi:hypothetical protein